MVANKLDLLRDIAEEHFDDYLLIVTKDKKVYKTFKSNVSAYGMASLVKSDIRQDWSETRDTKVEEDNSSGQI